MKENENVKSAGKRPISLFVENLVRAVDDLMVDSGKFDRGNKTAGVRVRVGLQSIVYEIKFIRDEILNRQKMQQNKKKGGDA